MNYRQFSRKIRLPLGFALGGAYLIFARPNPTLLPVGMALAVAGLFIRGWAAGHINKNSQLSVAGPYAFVRNPLYLGSFFLAIGFALAWSWAFVAVVIAFFVLIYAPTIQQERLTMLELFPTEYPAYEANVPAFVPRITPWKSAPRQEMQGTGRFSAARYMRHAEWKAALGCAAGLAWLLLRLKTGL